MQLTDSFLQGTLFTSDNANLLDTLRVFNVGRFVSLILDISAVML